LGGGKVAVGVDCGGSGFAVWTEALPLLAPLEPLLVLLEGPIVLESASIDMLNCGPGVTSDLARG
jgi:hypothetical protein